jgi:broad specificity phosphatase PhoE
MEAIDEITHHHRGEEIAVIAHGGTNRIILSSALGLPLENLLKMEQDFGCLNIIDYYDGAAVVKRINMAPWPA